MEEKQERIFKSIFAVTGKAKDLIKFEEVLKDHGIQGHISNEGARIANQNQGIPSMYKFPWIVIYVDYNAKTKECISSYAYRSTDCRKSSKKPPRVIKLSTAKRRLQKNYYFSKDGKKYLR